MPPKVGKGKGGKAAKGGKGGKGGKDADPNDPEVLFARAASKLNQEKQNLVSSLLPVLSQRHSRQRGVSHEEDLTPRDENPRQTNRCLPKAKPPFVYAGVEVSSQL